MAYFKSIFLAVWFCLFLAPNALSETLIKGYVWESLGNNIYLHRQLNTLQGPVDGNSVVIINPGDVIVVDTHINPAAARAVIKKIKKLTDKPVSIIVNTHWHDDHTNGNHAYQQAFPKVRILAHQNTMDALNREWAPMEEQRKKAYGDYSVEEILTAAKDVEESDPERAWNLRVYAGYMEALVPELDGLELIHPNLAIDKKRTFKRKRGRIVIEWLGKGNTEGDVVVWLPEDGVLITGDLLVSPIPFAFDSPLQDWSATLNKLSNFNTKLIVPGHGPVQKDQRYLNQLRSLLDLTLKRVVDAKDNNAEFDELEEVVDLSDFEAMFTGGDENLGYAWRSYYLRPGLKSAWVTLGYPLPEPE